MAYNQFAYWYDSLNTEADYDALAAAVLGALRRQGVNEGLVADLGCGTGELSLRLAAAGYDMIAVDASEDMLSVLRGKMDALEASPHILLLHQRLEELDLYGTVRAAVSTFDTLNHIPPNEMDAVFSRISLFLEPGGALAFDANSPYKHKEILAGKHFEIASALVPEMVCHWQNTAVGNGEEIRINIEGKMREKSIFREVFSEYTYTLNSWQALLEKHGLQLAEAMDGERFRAITQNSRRFFVVGRKP